MTRKELEFTPPTITLFASDRVAVSRLGDILLGIEEQGVPCDVATKTAWNPLTLAHEAALVSSLGIGIGVTDEYVVVTGDNLAVERPYLATKLNISQDSDRAVGGNAARIVKRMPLVI